MKIFKITRPVSYSTRASNFSSRMVNLNPGIYYSTYMPTRLDYSAEWIYDTEQEIFTKSRFEIPIISEYELSILIMQATKL
jgi:capsule polysaccharide export protein KpsC/LpsZ